MKNKYILLLLLFSVVILFSLLGTMNEGFEDMPVPLCESSKNSNVNSCKNSNLVTSSNECSNMSSHTKFNNNCNEVCNVNVDPICPEYSTNNKESLVKGIFDSKLNENDISEYNNEIEQLIKKLNTLIPNDVEKTSIKNPLVELKQNDTEKQDKITETNLENYSVEESSVKGIFDSKLNENDISEYNIEINKLKEKLNTLIPNDVENTSIDELLSKLNQNDISKIMEIQNNLKSTDAEKIKKYISTL